MSSRRHKGFHHFLNETMTKSDKTPAPEKAGAPITGLPSTYGAKLGGVSTLSKTAKKRGMRPNELEKPKE
jgi:hypothetical protein